MDFRWFNDPFIPENGWCFFRKHQGKSCSPLPWDLNRFLRVFAPIKLLILRWLGSTSSSCDTSRVPDRCGQWWIEMWDYMWWLMVQDEVDGCILLRNQSSQSCLLGKTRAGVHPCPSIFDKTSVNYCWAVYLQRHWRRTAAIFCAKDKLGGVKHVFFWSPNIAEDSHFDYWL